MFQPASVDSICLKNLNHNFDPQLLLFINILKPSLINLKIIATVSEVIVILIVDLHVTPDINLVLTRTHILVLDTMINPTLIIILLKTTVINLDMTNIIIKHPSSHSFLHVHIIILPLPVGPSKYYPRSRERSSSYKNSSFKRYNSPYRSPFKPRNERYRSRSHSNSKTTLIFNMNSLLILLTHLHHLFKVILLWNPNLKLICTTPLLLHHSTLHSPLNMLTLLHLQLGLLIYIFSNPLKILRSLPN